MFLVQDPELNPRAYTQRFGKIKPDIPAAVHKITLAVQTQNLTSFRIGYDARVPHETAVQIVARVIVDLLPVI
jgi:hypothetical protein